MGFLNVARVLVVQLLCQRYPLTLTSLIAIPFFFLFLLPFEPDFGDSQNSDTDLNYKRLSFRLKEQRSDSFDRKKLD